MIALHLLQLLEDEGFGTIDDKSGGLFYEKLPLGAVGVAIFSRGGPMGKGRRNEQSFDLYARGANDLLGADKLEKIKEYFEQNETTCQLPIVPGLSNKIYSSATVEMTDNVENLGLDENDRVVFRLSGRVNYNK